MTTNPLRADELRERFSKQHEKWLIGTDDDAEAAQEWCMENLPSLLALLTPPPSLASVDLDALTKIFPVEIENTPDYANVLFNDTKSQCMTLEPEVWLKANDELRTALTISGTGWRDDWIKTTDRLPEKPGVKSYEYVDCLIVVKGEVIQRPWNCEHLCWDDVHYDDFEFHPTEPTHWMPLPNAPQPKTGDA